MKLPNFTFDIRISERLTSFTSALRLHNTAVTVCLFALAGMQSNMDLELLFACFVCGIVTASAVNTTTFTPLYANGFPVCATDRPNVVIPISTAQIGIPLGVPASVACGYSCTMYTTTTCKGYNYRLLPSGSAGGAQCELYTYVPGNCTTSNNSSCQYFQVDNLRFSTASLEPWGGGGRTADRLNATKRLSDSTELQCDEQVSIVNEFNP
jgi:putative hemolysin